MKGFFNSLTSFVWKKENPTVTGTFYRIKNGINTRLIFNHCTVTLELDTNTLFVESGKDCLNYTVSAEMDLTSYEKAISWTYQSDIWLVRLDEQSDKHNFAINICSLIHKIVTGKTSKDEHYLMRYMLEQPDDISETDQYDSSLDSSREDTESRSSFASLSSESVFSATSGGSYSSSSEEVLLNPNMVNDIPNVERMDQHPHVSLSSSGSRTTRSLSSESISECVDLSSSQSGESDTSQFSRSGYSSTSDSSISVVSMDDSSTQESHSQVSLSSRSRSSTGSLSSESISDCVDLRSSQSGESDSSQFSRSEYTSSAESSFADASTLDTDFLSSDISDDTVNTILSRELISVEGTLYLLHENNKDFVPVEKDVDILICNACYKKKKGKNIFRYKLCIVKDDEIALSQYIDSTMLTRFYFDKASGITSFLWMSTAEEEIFVWSVLFTSNSDAKLFKKSFVKYLWEANAQKNFETNKAEDKAWILGGYDYDIDIDEDALKEENNLFFDNSSEESIAEYETRGRNQFLAVGRTSDLSFVGKGSNLEVFQYGEDGIEHRATVPDISDRKGRVFEPEQALLHQEDTSLLLLHPDKRSVVYKMDLERGDIVEEWDTGGLSVNQIIPASKYAQRTPANTFIAINDGGFFTMDPRVPDIQRVDSRSFQYKYPDQTQFSCGATTQDGHLVVGSNMGDIRLYNSNNMQKKSKIDTLSAPRSKNRLPGYGDPIVGIDVSSDGKWIVSTAETYLVVMPASVGDTDITGFHKPMKGGKTPPRILQLRQEHMREMGMISFSPAKFNQGFGEETSIVTSTGNYIITWDFKKVQNNILDNYQIRRYKIPVVSDDFSFNNDKNVVVATVGSVSLATRRYK
eukprot:TRINITY_DN1674_c1_g5_i1.p1 TRINITY_DN1674_c1_g5~~TRINITY_DN1674_c1_g5_i1.p1  ORF type:complete len:869 (+),score=186.84 TRINITY_DN1674_c1_g5_i1:22-2607(+)